MTMRLRQMVLARMIDDPDFEARLRNAPESVAEEHKVDLEFVQGLAAIEPRRLEAFRASRRHKDAVRAGTPPRRL